jgi:hypothetical protein
MMRKIYILDQHTFERSSKPIFIPLLFSLYLLVVEESFLFIDIRSKMSDLQEKKVLVTGGGGYIGSHCILQLLEHKFKVLAIDNFDNTVQGKLTLEVVYK